VEISREAVLLESSVVSSYREDPDTMIVDIDVPGSIFLRGRDSIKTASSVVKPAGLPTESVGDGLLTVVGGSAITSVCITGKIEDISTRTLKEKAGYPCCPSTHAVASLTVILNTFGHMAIGYTMRS
jgi:hypothetical protein